MNYSSLISNTPSLSLDVPADLKENFHRLEQVIRFDRDDYPPGAIVDNVKTHVIRGIHFIQSLDLENKDKVVRMFLIHDFPEIVTGDTPSPTKDIDFSKDDMNHYESEEKTAAKQLYSEDDYRLWQEYATASAWFKEKSDNMPTYEAMIAKTVDAIDGFCVFHYFMTDWIRSDNYSKGQMPLDSSMVHGFKDMARFQNKLSLLAEHQQETPRLLYKNAEKTAIKMWDDVPNDRIPSCIVERL
ncbi:MAG: HD domain-containing protein [Gammaproteobacteria bacterium]|nr:HD domain-containing protein [Gammaproteobacteria bacterium]